MKDKYIKRLNKLLKKLNIEKLKDKQEQIINELIVNKNDVIGLLPTGYGKSLTYLIPPIITRKIIFIISPLISLMEDQKEKLDKIDVPVAALHSNNPYKHHEQYDVIDGYINIVYMSPEYLINGEGLELAKTLYEKKMLKYLAIDEAHCISTWGHDFRSEYLQISKFRGLFPKIPILAVTATATHQVVDDIRTFLNLENPLVVRCNFDRPNLYLDIKDQKGNVIKLIEPYIEKYIYSNDEDKIIIYTNSRKEAEQINYDLNCIKKKLSVVYHAKLSKKLRYMIQKQFNNDEIRIIVCTTAFGMGIDQTVRCVLVFGAPSSIEEYYQQIGRAGRDRLPAETVLFFYKRNFMIAKSQLDKYSNDKIKFIKIKNLNKMYGLYDTKSCRRKYILEYFGQVPKFFNCNNCDNCINKNKNITKKMFKYLIKNKDFNTLFSDKIKNELLKNQMIIFNKQNKQFEPSNELINWKRIIIVNKITLETMKEQFKIFI